MRERHICMLKRVLTDFNVFDINFLFAFLKVIKCYLLNATSHARLQYQTVGYLHAATVILSPTCSVTVQHKLTMLQPSVCS